MNITVNGDSVSNNKTLKDYGTISSFSVSPATYRYKHKDTHISISSKSDIDEFYIDILDGYYVKEKVIYFIFMSGPSLKYYLIDTLCKISLPEVVTFSFQGIVMILFLL